MKKAFLIIVIIGVAVFIAWATHVVEFYTISTTSNQPTYQPGHLAIASKFKHPDRGNFIVFSGKHDQPWIFRVIAKGGDYVEIRQTAIYLNGKILNEPYAGNEYFIRKTDLNKIDGQVKSNNNLIKPMNDSISIITLTPAEVTDYKVPVQICSLPVNKINPNILLEFRQWLYNEDNLGPIKVPDNSYFVLGDSRHDAYDSRYFGFVAADKVMSTVIN